jgi:CO/xanthine dehydrogenase Mo-binding subunit
MCTLVPGGYLPGPKSAVARSDGGCRADHSDGVLCLAAMWFRAPRRIDARYESAYAYALRGVVPRPPEALRFVGRAGRTYPFGILSVCVQAEAPCWIVGRRL